MAKKKGDEKANPAPQSDNEEQNFEEEPDFDDPEDFVEIPEEGRHFFEGHNSPAICLAHGIISIAKDVLSISTV